MPSCNLIRLSVLIVLISVTIGAGPPPTLKRHPPSKTEDKVVETPATPPEVADIIENVIVAPNILETNTTELSDRFQRIQDSLKAISALVQGRMAELQEFIEESQDMASKAPLV